MTDIPKPQPFTRKLEEKGIVYFDDYHIDNQISITFYTIDFDNFRCVYTNEEEFEILVSDIVEEYNNGVFTSYRLLRNNENRDPDEIVVKDINIEKQITVYRKVENL